MVNPPPTIVLNSSGNRLQTKDGKYYVEFEFNGRPLKMNIIRTVSPPWCRDYLLDAAFKHAREVGGQIETTCPLARVYEQNHHSSWGERERA